MTIRNAWASDTPISEPIPPDPDRPIMAKTGEGFGFTTQGLAYDITEEEAEYVFTPTYGPPDFSREG